MKWVQYFIHFAFVVTLWSCEPEPIGLVHVRIEAYTAPGNQPVDSARFILYGASPGQVYDELDYVLHECAILKTDSNGIIDTLIYPTNDYRWYSLRPDVGPGNYLTTFGYQTIEKAGSYAYYAAYNFPAYLKCNIDFDSLASNNRYFHIWGDVSAHSLYSYPDANPDTILFLKVVGGSQVNTVKIQWPIPTGGNMFQTLIFHYSNIAPFDTLAVNFIEP